MDQNLRPHAPEAIVIGSALGDALGAGYEYGCAPLPAGDQMCQMIGGGLGNFKPVEWTDDTSMAVPILMAAAKYRDALDSAEALSEIAEGFLAWYRTNPPDVGGHTSRVLSLGARAVSAGQDAGDALSSAAAASWRTGSVSNGGIMRTNPAVLPYLNDHGPARAAKTAADIAALTHAEEASTVPTALWVGLVWAGAHGYSPTDAVAIAVDALPEEFQNLAVRLLDPVISATPTPPPNTFRPNGNAEQCLQAAIASIWPLWLADPDGSSPENFLTAIDRAVKSGADTDTVACVAGGLAGAIWGLSAVPESWTENLHGYPGMRGHQLAEAARTAAS